MSQARACGVPFTLGELDGGQELIFDTADNFNAMWTQLYMVFGDTAWHYRRVPDPIVNLEDPADEQGF